MSATTIPARVILGDGIISIQIVTSKAPGRPFSAATVLVDIWDDGQVDDWHEGKGFRKELIRQIREDAADDGLSTSQ